MKFLRKKMNYTIITSMDENINIQRFADKYSVKGSIVEVITYNPMFKADIVEIGFVSREDRAYIVNELMKKFKDYNFRIKENFIFMNK